MLFSIFLTAYISEEVKLDFYFSPRPINRPVLAWLVIYLQGTL